MNTIFFDKQSIYTAVLNRLSELSTEQIDLEVFKIWDLEDKLDILNNRQLVNREGVTESDRKKALKSLKNQFLEAEEKKRYLLFLNNIARSSKR